MAPTVRALAGDDVLVIAAGVRDQSQLGRDSVPANARIERFVPFKPPLPMVDGDPDRRPGRERRAHDPRDPDLRERARVIQAELSAKDAPALAASLLERLAKTGAPVLRG